MKQVSLEIIKNYILVHATVNAAHEGRFLLDTGADATVIATPFANRLGLKTTSYHVGGVAGGKKIKVPLSSIDALSIEGSSTPLETVAIVDLERDPGPYGRIDGVIGSDFLREFPVTIDYPGKILTFEDRTTLESRVQNGTTLKLKLRDATTPFIRVWLNNAPRGFYKLDTGAAVTHLPLQDFDSLGIKEESPQVNVQESTGLGGTYRVLSTRVNSFSLGAGLEVNELQVKSYECEYGFIGGNYLRNFTITLNYKEQCITLARPSSYNLIP